MLQCTIPDLDYKYHLNDNEPMIECRLKQNWGYIDTNTHTWHLREDTKKMFKKIECTYRKINRINDFKISVGRIRLLKENQEILHEIVEVFCDGYDEITNRNISQKFDGLYVQLIEKSKSPKTPQKLHVDDENGCTPMNVMLLSYDSVSRVSWTNRLPKTIDFLKNKMKFEILNGYNIVGDGTPAALIPIYAGKTEEELPSVLKNDPKGKYVDEAYPFIWKDLKNKDYMSIYLDDCPHFSAFTYRMRGFLNHTTDHYVRQYQLRLRERNRQRSKKGEKDDLCNGDTKRHKILMNLLTDFKKMYNNKMLNIAFMHFVENSHDSNRRLNWIDDDIYTFLLNGYEQNLFENTAIFLYSDHGSRFNDKRDEKAKQRYIEERLPFFSVYLPESFKMKHPEKMKNFLRNKNLLTSPFDIYSTVRDLTCLDKSNGHFHDDHSRSISLFNEISEFRSCEDIGIPEHFCSCVRPWQHESIDSIIVREVTNYAIDSINNITDSSRNLCAVLYLKKIITSEILVKSSLLILHKTQFVTSPNNGIYEVLVYLGDKEGFEFRSEKFSIKSRNDISRIDAYGEQPKCVSNFGRDQGLILDLRKFCFCVKRKNKN